MIRTTCWMKIILEVLLLTPQRWTANAFTCTLDPARLNEIPWRAGTYCDIQVASGDTWDYYLPFCSNTCREIQETCESIDTSSNVDEGVIELCKMHERHYADCCQDYIPCSYCGSFGYHAANPEQEGRYIPYLGTEYRTTCRDFEIWNDIGWREEGVRSCHEHGKVYYESGALFQCECNTFPTLSPFPTEAPTMSPTRFSLNNEQLREAVALFLENRTAAESSYGEITRWPVSRVTNMSALFRGAADFNEDLAGWMVQRVTDMSYMFAETNAFNHYGIQHWTTTSLHTASHMFENAVAFNQDLHFYPTTNLATIEYMFRNATSYAQELGFELEAYTKVTSMFCGSQGVFDRFDLSDGSITEAQVDQAFLDCPDRKQGKYNSSDTSTLGFLIILSPIILLVLGVLGIWWCCYRSGCCAGLQEWSASNEDNLPPDHPSVGYDPATGRYYDRHTGRECGSNGVQLGYQ